MDTIPPPAAKAKDFLSILDLDHGSLERLPAPEVPWAERVLCCSADGVED